VGYDISYDRLVGWEADLRLLTERVAGSLFTRPEPRATFTDLVRGLLADVPRKNSWQVAEHVGHGSAYRLEWLLNGAKWDADALRDRVRDYVVATLGAEDGVLIADDTQVGDQEGGASRWEWPRSTVGRPGRRRTACYPCSATPPGAGTRSSTGAVSAPAVDR
jgi:DDE superfamily endonuclease